jgi:hypothetical protein
MTTLLLFVLTALAGDETTRWTTTTVKLQRWQDAPIVAAELEPNTRVEVLFEEGPLVRVRRGMDFGWVAKDALTDVPPAGTATTPPPFQLQIPPPK